MSAREIPAGEWTEFLEWFSRAHRAWLVTVQQHGAVSLGRADGVERPLRSVRPLSAGRRVEQIEIRFQEDSRPIDPILIDGPVAVRIDESAEGIARGLEILDEEGGSTRIRFRAAKASEALDGLAPGEAPAR